MSYISEDQITYYLSKQGITIRPVVSKEDMCFYIAVFKHGIEQFRYNRKINSDYKKSAKEITVSQALIKTEKHIYNKIMNGEDVV